MFDMLPIDFPMVSLSNVHPCYFSIRPEDVTVDVNVNVDSLSVVFTRDKRSRASEGLGLQLSRLVINSTHTLMTRFFDCSLASLGLYRLTTTDCFTSPDAITDGTGILLSVSQGPAVTLKTTYFMPQSVLAGKLILHAAVAPLSCSIRTTLLASTALLLDAAHPIRRTLELAKSRASTKAVTKKESSQRTVELHCDCGELELWIHGEDDASGLHVDGERGGHVEGERGGHMEGDRNGRGEDDFGLRLTVGTLSFVDMGTKELSIDTILLQLDGTGVLSLGGLADSKGFALSLTPEKDLSISLGKMQCNLNPSLQLQQLTAIVQVGTTLVLSSSPTRCWISPGFVPRRLRCPRRRPRRRPLPLPPLPLPLPPPPSLPSASSPPSRHFS